MAETMLENDVPYPPALSIWIAMIDEFQATPATPATVVSNRCYGASDMRTMPISVHRIGIPVDEIKAMHIVDEAISIVVDLIPSNLSPGFVQMFSAKSGCL